jgi:hypothetical protein
MNTCFTQLAVASNPPTPRLSQQLHVFSHSKQLKNCDASYHKANKTPLSLPPLKSQYPPPNNPKSTQHPPTQPLLNPLRITLLIQATYQHRVINQSSAEAITDYIIRNCKIRSIAICKQIVACRRVAECCEASAAIFDSIGVVRG